MKLTIFEQTEILLESMYKTLNDAFNSGEAHIYQCAKKNIDDLQEFRYFLYMKGNR